MTSDLERSLLSEDKPKQRLNLYLISIFGFIFGALLCDIFCGEVSGLSKVWSDHIFSGNVLLQSDLPPILPIPPSPFDPGPILPPAPFPKSCGGLLYPIVEVCNCTSEEDYDPATNHCIQYGTKKNYCPFGNCTQIGGVGTENHCDGGNCTQYGDTNTCENGQCEQVGISCTCNGGHCHQVCIGDGKDFRPFVPESGIHCSCDGGGCVSACEFCTCAAGGCDQTCDWCECAGGNCNQYCATAHCPQYGNKTHPGINECPIQFCDDHAVIGTLTDPDYTPVRCPGYDPGPHCEGGGCSPTQSP